MITPTPRHPKLRLLKFTRVEGPQDLLSLAAHVRFHPHTFPFQVTAKRLRDGGTKQHIHAQFSDAARQRLDRERSQENFPALSLPKIRTAHQKQARSRVEHR